MDNFVDFDVSTENLRAGQRLAIGTAIIEITAEPHDGCAKFTKRYGRDATMFVNHKDFRHMRLRGVYARVVQDGRDTRQSAARFQQLRPADRVDSIAACHQTPAA